MISGQTLRVCPEGKPVFHFSGSCSNGAATAPGSSFNNQLEQQVGDRTESAGLLQLSDPMVVASQSFVPPALSAEVADDKIIRCGRPCYLRQVRLAGLSDGA
jgi:hypothetical protein